VTGLPPRSARAHLVCRYPPQRTTPSGTIIGGALRIGYRPQGDGEVARSGPGEVIQLEREQLLTLIQTDPELSEILMRAFMLRRLELITNEFGDAVMIGSAHCAGTQRVAGIALKSRSDQRRQSTAD
jgi:hypothetical protein